MKKLFLLSVLFASSQFTIALANEKLSNVIFEPCEVKSKDLKGAKKEMEAISKKVSNDLDIAICGKKGCDANTVSVKQQMKAVIEVAEKYKCEIKEVHIKAKN